MPRIDKYRCCICKKIIKYKPTRLVKQMYGINPHYKSQYSQCCVYNFCDECYKKFDNWVNRRKQNEPKQSN